jgi:hypothetical protein
MRFGRQKKENELPEIRAYAPGIYARSEELVQATARNASDEAATEFLGHVAELSSKNAAPIDVRSWVSRNIESGGQALWTEGDRTLEIVATAPPAARASKTTEQTTNRPPI